VEGSNDAATLFFFFFFFFSSDPDPEATGADGAAVDFAFGFDVDDDEGFAKGADLLAGFAKMSSIDVTLFSFFASFVALAVALFLLDDFAMLTL